MNTSYARSPRSLRHAALLGSLLVAAAVNAPPARAASQSVTLSNFMFAPAALTVVAGDTVTWSYNGQDGRGMLYGAPVGPAAPHNVRFLKDGSRLSGNADGSPSAAAWSKSRMFTSAGAFSYYCEVHGAPDGSGMAGTITVAGGAGPQAAPVLSGGIARGRLCAKRSARCRIPGLRLTLRSSEAATFRATLQLRSTRTGRLRRFGALRLRLRAGINRLKVTRTLTGKRLGPGRYRLVGRATDSGGQRSAPLTRTFTIRR